MNDAVGGFDVGLNDVSDGLADDGVALLFDGSAGLVRVIGEGHLDSIFGGFGVSKDELKVNSTYS